MKILLTGATGFTGSTLLKKLIDDGHEVIILCRKLPIELFPGVTCILSDLKNVYQHKGIIGYPDAIIHTAASVNFDTSMSGTSKILQDNILGTQILASFAAELGVQKFIFSSTCSVYKESLHFVNEESDIRPLNNYGISKLTGEWLAYDILLNKVPEFAILRYSSIYGFGQRPNTILPIFIDNAKKNATIEIFGTGERLQDYVHVNDVAQANLLCLNNKLGFADCYNIGSGIPTSDIQLAQSIVKNWNSKSDIKILSKNCEGEVSLKFSIEKAKVNIGYQPSSLSEGLRFYQTRF